MTETIQQDALYLAAELRAGYWTPNILQNESALRDRAADVLMHLHAENTTLQQGYAAARLEIESLRARLACECFPSDGWLQEGSLLYRLTDDRHPVNRDEINVAMADGSRSIEDRTRRASELLDCIRAEHGEEPAPQPADRYPALPEPGINTASHAHFRVIGYTAEQMRAFADATHTLRASHGQAPAQAAGWQPIETAPKDSCARLVWCPARQNTYTVTWLKGHGWIVFGGRLLSEEEAPTHWMPLPPPPSGSKEVAHG